ncbi:MAG TPA: DUF2934 domain-containing protein [Burkholderiales bacterium]|nr:DUF2934 domain-containing protein [Burkholderiales bacterium]
MATSQTGKTRSATTRKAPPAAPKSPPVVKAAAPAKKKATASKPKVPAIPAMNSPEWNQMVATAAYLRAEARGFIGGSAEEDWFEAEAEIMAKVGNGKAVG